MATARFNWWSIGCTGILAIAASAQGATIYVDARVATSGDGVTNWASAKKTIQEGVGAAGSGDVVWVAGRIPDMQANPPIPGLIYTPTNQTSGYIQLKSGVRILGGFRGNDGTSNNPNDRDPATFVTILSGDLGNGVHARRVVVSPANTAPPSGFSVADRVNLDGFTITGGDAQFDNGGGIFIVGGLNVTNTAVFRNCIVTGNVATEGGGVYAGAEAHPVFRKCRFVSNAAYGGGAVSSVGTAAFTFIDCIFDSNVAYWRGGAFDGSIRSTGVDFINCTFTNNEVEDFAGTGGAIRLVGASSATYNMHNCVFINNRGDGGGALYLNDPGTVNVVNCTFSENDGDSAGGAIYAFGSVCTVNLRNSILWGDMATTSSEIHNPGSMATINVTYSDVQLGSGTWSGTGNINDDPDFIGSGNYRLSCGSPCINTANNSDAPADADDANENGSTIEKIDRDLGGRVLLGTVDMGAFEAHAYDSECPNLAGDPCLINVMDLLEMFDNWLNSGVGDIAPNCGGDGVVNVQDMLALFNAWGACPCFQGTPDETSFPTSVQDCMDDATSLYTQFSPEWDEYMNKCVDALCEAQIINCD